MQQLLLPTMIKLGANEKIDTVPKQGVLLITEVELLKFQLRAHSSHEMFFTGVRPPQVYLLTIKLFLLWNITCYCNSKQISDFS